jgi:hypothetical protein
MNRREVLTAIGGSVYALDARAQVATAPEKPSGGGGLLGGASPLASKHAARSGSRFSSASPVDESGSFHGALKFRGERASRKHINGRCDFELLFDACGKQCAELLLFVDTL